MLTYGSPSTGSAQASIATRTAPLVELRSSQAVRPSAMPMVSDPEAVRRSTEPLVDGTEISPEPDEARRSAAVSERTSRSPDPDLAVRAQRASPITRSPEPLVIRAALPPNTPTDTEPEPE